MVYHCRYAALKIISSLSYLCSYALKAVLEILVKIHPITLDNAFSSPFCSGICAR